MDRRDKEIKGIRDIFLGGTGRNKVDFSFRSFNGNENETKIVLSAFSTFAVDIFIILRNTKGGVGCLRITKSCCKGAFKIKISCLL